MIWQGESKVIGSVYNEVLSNPGDGAEYVRGTVTLPPGTLAPGRAIRVTALAETVASGTNTARLEVRLNGIGGTNIVESAAIGANRGARGVDGIVVGTGAASQILFPNLVGKHTITDAISNSFAGDETLDYTQEIDVVFILSLIVDFTGEATLHYGCVEQLS